MGNARRGRHYRAAQREVETRQAVESACTDGCKVDVKYVALGVAFVMLVFVKGLVIGYFLGNDD